VENGIGKPVLRNEDKRLLTGHARTGLANHSGRQGQSVND
jgi:hypothetical protein